MVSFSFNSFPPLLKTVIEEWASLIQPQLIGSFDVFCGFYTGANVSGARKVILGGTRVFSTGALAGNVEIKRCDSFNFCILHTF